MPAELATWHMLVVMENEDSNNNDPYWKQQVKCKKENKNAILYPAHFDNKEWVG